jgi:hypothetical protein
MTGSMAEDTVLRTLQTLNADLSDLADSFIRLVKAARMQPSVQEGGLSLSGSAGMEIVVESLVANASEILNKVVALKRGQIFGNSDRALYETVRRTQYKLHAVVEKSTASLQNNESGPVHEMRSLLKELEAHYSRSKYVATAQEESERSDLDALCSEAMHAYLTLDK